MRFDILTIFPEMFEAFLRRGVLGRAVGRGIVTVNLVQLRDYALDPHRSTDDRPFGGGSGMVMKPGPIFRALRALKRVGARSQVILLSPQGATFNQEMAWALSRWHQLILLCGRYEGIDERVVSLCVDREVSLGDFVLSGGEPAAMVLMDAVSRLIPGVLGGECSHLEESFEGGLLDYPQYTRPRVFEGKRVPQVLLTGDHARIRLWRRKAALRSTVAKRPDLLRKARLEPEDRALLAEISREA